MNDRTTRLVGCVVWSETWKRTTWRIFGSGVAIQLVNRTDIYVMVHPPAQDEVGNTEGEEGKEMYQHDFRPYRSPSAWENKYAKETRTDIVNWSSLWNKGVQRKKSYKHSYRYRGWNLEKTSHRESLSVVELESVDRRSKAYLTGNVECECNRVTYLGPAWHLNISNLSTSLALSTPGSYNYLLSGL